MSNLNERPVCHRAEDLVTYLYGEASEAETADFREHLRQCVACRNEFGVFNQVHESILDWRNEALGSSFNPSTIVAEPSVNSTQFMSPERKLSAFAALREFFNVSPLWLRGATAFAGLLLCMLLGLAISRSLRGPAPVVTEAGAQKVFTQAEFDQALAREVKVQTDKLKQELSASQKEITRTETPAPKTEVVKSRAPGPPRIKGLTQEEREQLAADLRLIPAGDDDELPFVISDQPNH